MAVLPQMGTQSIAAHLLGRLGPGAFVFLSIGISGDKVAEVEYALVVDPAACVGIARVTRRLASSAISQLLAQVSAFSDWNSTDLLRCRALAGGL